MRCQAIEAEAAKLEQVVDAKTKSYLDAATKKELAKFPEPLRTKLGAVLATPVASQSKEQKHCSHRTPA